MHKESRQNREDFKLWEENLAYTVVRTHDEYGEVSHDSEVQNRGPRLGRSITRLFLHIRGPLIELPPRTSGGPTLYEYIPLSEDGEVPEQ